MTEPPITDRQKNFITGHLLLIVGKPGLQLAKKQANVPQRITIEKLTRKQAARVIRHMVLIKNHRNQYLKKRSDSVETVSTESKEKV